MSTTEQKQFSQQISTTVYVFRFFCLPLASSISGTDIYAFVECICPLRDTLSDFVCSSRSQIWTQVQILRSFFFCPFLAHKGITDEFNRSFLTWQPFQMFRSCYPLLRREFFRILVQQSQISEILTILLFCFCFDFVLTLHSVSSAIRTPGISSKNIPLSVVFSTLFSRWNTISHVWYL